MCDLHLLHIGSELPVTVVPFGDNVLLFFFEITFESIDLGLLIMHVHVRE